MLALIAIFAAEPKLWYEDFTFWVSFLTALSVVGGATWGIAWMVVRLRFGRERDRLRRDLRAASEELRELKSFRGQDRNDLAQSLTNSQYEAQQLKENLTASQHDADRLQKIIEGLNRNLRIAQQMEGLTWRARPNNGPSFTPLQERRLPILAVLNLKGGVGKTTLAANLAVAYARTGWRVLLIDLDLQASLTSLFITGEQLQQAAQKQRLIQHYFEQSSTGGRPQFLDFIQECTEPRVELLGSADTLAYAELFLTIRWLLQPGKSDPRLILRDALHGSSVRRFDLVLIDCPPLLNISCVNALAAADFLLIPVVPSKSATDRVRPMIGWLRLLRQNLNPDLKIIGVTANRIAKSTGMSAGESNLWAALRDQCHDAWGEPVPLCQTFIPQSAEVRDAENERRPLRADDRMFDFFKKLATELAGRLPQSCRPTHRAVITSGAIT